MSANLLGCQAVPWLDMGRQTWACLSWTRRPLQRVPWLRLSFLALLLVLWLGLPVPMQSAKTFEHKKVNGTSFGDLKVDKGATSHECFDTLPEFSIDPMLLDRNSFCQPCGSFPNQPEVWHTALSGEQKDQIGQAVQSALKAMPKEGQKTVELTFDTGATRTSVGIRSDFVEFAEAQVSQKLDGIAAGLSIKGQGIVEYHMSSDEGIDFVLRLKAFYVPDLNNTRLVSPQGIRTAEGHRGSFVAHCNDEDPNSFAELLIRHDKTGWQKSTPVHVTTVQYNPRNNLPTHTGTFKETEEFHGEALEAALCVTEETNTNLTGAQKELLRWHFRLGHVGFQHIQWLVRSGKLLVTNPKAVANCDLPKCASCEFGKATRRATKTLKQKAVPEKESELKKGDLLMMIARDAVQENMTLLN